MNGNEALSDALRMYADRCYSVPGFPVTDVGRISGAEMVINEKTEQDLKAVFQIILDTLEKEDVGAIKVFAEALVGIALVEGKITFHEKDKWEKELASEATFPSAIERYSRLTPKLKVRSSVRQSLNN